MDRIVGLDFGTTNSALSIMDPGQSPKLMRFYRDSGPTAMFRSVLYFTPEALETQRRPAPVCGPQGIDLYLEEDDGSGRLMQSLKTWLASTSFTHTIVGPRARFTLEELIALIVRDMRMEAEATLGPLGNRVTVGRPVHLSRPANPERDEHAIGRLRKALAMAGFDEVNFVYEPLAAAYHYEQRLEHDEVVLIADFGGGTSDFSLLRVGPGCAARGERMDDVLGNAGVPLAGNALDGRLVQRLVAPHLGMGSEYRTPFGKLREIPRSIFKLQWHELSTLRSQDTARMLAQYRRSALDPDRIANFQALVEGDLGYRLYQAIEGVKIALSTQPETTFAFDELHAPIRAEVSRERFESWIAPELESISQCVDGLLEETGVGPDQVDRIFMTGGTSFIPAVRQIFSDRFGAHKLTTGEELTSVASGLTLLGQAAMGT